MSPSLPEAPCDFRPPITSLKSHGEEPGTAHRRAGRATAASQAAHRSPAATRSHAGTQRTTLTPAEAA